MGFDILNYASSLQCRELHMAIQDDIDLKAIVAIHNTTLGPALGGCRWIEYPSTESAVVDAIRLAQAMTYKAALARLPLGGGKLVLLKPKQVNNKETYFKAVGRFVNSLDGRYITAVDSGTSTNDMDIIATETKHVTSTTQSVFSVADPSIMTAEGVEKGIAAAVKIKLGRESLQGIQVSIQGLGHAGYHLAKNLHARGASLTVYDINPTAVDRCVQEFSAKTVNSIEALLALPVDVFSPCALGAILNDKTIPLLKAPIIAGSANNQLAESRHGVELMQRGILYAPDYVINAGGLIYVAAQISHMTEEAANLKVRGIYETLLEIFQRSQLENISPEEIANKIAEERLRG